MCDCVIGYFHDDLTNPIILVLLNIFHLIFSNFALTSAVLMKYISHDFNLKYLKSKNLLCYFFEMIMCVCMYIIIMYLCYMFAILIH